MVAANICGSSKCSLLYITLLTPRILRWPLDFWKNLCTPVSDRIDRSLFCTDLQVICKINYFTVIQIRWRQGWYIYLLYCSAWATRLNGIKYNLCNSNLFFTGTSVWWSCNKCNKLNQHEWIKHECKKIILNNCIYSATNI